MEEELHVTRPLRRSDALRLESASVRSVRRARRPLLALVALVVALAVGYAVQGSGGGSHHPARSSSASASTTAGEVALSTLPPQVAATVGLIRSDGPFPYPRNDGVVFHNNEHVLPRQADGYYHEYTVPTPGSGDRGARRLITGRDGEFFYTDDHYETFRRVRVDR
jgi:ribonuclease T1